MSTLRSSRVFSFDTQTITEIVQQWIADDPRRENGPVETFVVRREEVTHKEVQDAARLWWENHGAIPNQSEEVQKEEYCAARKRLLEQPLGLVQIIISRNFIGIPMIWAASCGDSALRERVILDLLQQPIDRMRSINSSSTIIRAVVMPWCNRDVATVVNSTKGWCCVSILEGGKVYFFQHDHA